MAAANIAFEAPDNSAGYRPFPSRPIDLVHLAAHTKGDQQREIEALQAFARQARHCLLDLLSENSQVMLSAAGRLKNASRVVGAERVTTAAERLETEGADAASLANISAAIVEAENYILKLCR